MDNRLDLKYMNGEFSDEYKRVLEESTLDNIKPLVDYMEIKGKKPFLLMWFPLESKQKY